MNKKILVVDDDPGLQQTTEAILDFEGYEVEVAGEGIEALAKLDTLVPGVSLLDLMMPRMDGFAFAEKMGRRGLRPAIPLLVLTADGRADQKASRIDAEGYLAKPFDVASLLAEVDRLLR